MKKLSYKSKEFELEKYETVLDCLLRNGEAIPYACKAGMCQACLIRAVDCSATEESKKWIKPALRAKGFTLACQWVPQDDVKAELPSVEDFSVQVKIKALTALNEQVLRVLLDVSDPAKMFSYRPGQYLTLINPQGIARSYSIANDYEVDQYIELHIANTQHGVFTKWIFSSAAVGDELHMRGAAGDCFYQASDASEHPLLLIGTGTGLAPLYGILQDAIAQGHEQAITLIHGGRSAKQLYYTDEIQALASKHKQLSYYPCTIEESKQSKINTGSVESILETHLNQASLAQCRVYLCGAPDFVHKLRKQIFLKGARAANIHCDPFTERKVVTNNNLKA